MPGVMVNFVTSTAVSSCDHDDGLVRPGGRFCGSAAPWQPRRGGRRRVATLGPRDAADRPRVQSETTFVLPPTRAQADSRLRAFTPAGKEAGGAGHHTLGTWWWLAESGALRLTEGRNRFTQEDGHGLLVVTITCASGQPVLVGLSQGAPEFGAVCDDYDGLADALTLTTRDLATAGLPAQVVSTGVHHLLVPLRDRAAVDRARPDVHRLAAILQRLGGEGCYLFSRDTINPDSIAHARFFNPTLGIAEDAATGTAAGPLASQLVAHRFASADGTLHIEQGHAMGRPSLIQVHVSTEAVTISGRYVVSCRGRLRVA
jgi:trans-2,3-dihydro-3-hydroxyanthranilate isomerase